MYLGVNDYLQARNKTCPGTRRYPWCEAMHDVQGFNNIFPSISVV
jgi:hypothetical protein